MTTSTEQPTAAPLILCIDGLEAKLMRHQHPGSHCVTAARLRATLSAILQADPEDAQGAAVVAISRFTFVSSADSPERWSMWKHPALAKSTGAKAARKALAALPSTPTPLRDPVDVIECRAGEFWQPSGTTVFVGADTFDLVRIADTYAKFDPYRHCGRMDEPFAPVAGRCCLVAEHELRLLQLSGVEDVEIVLCYKLEPQKVTGREVTPHPSPRAGGPGVSLWPTALRALCGGRPDLRVGVAPCLVAARHGHPFMLGITRGMAFETEETTSTAGAGALNYCIQTNRRAESVQMKVVVWEGGDDVRQLAQYGGLSVFMNAGGRRKVQLRSLGLRRAAAVAGAWAYNMTDNYRLLMDWAITRTFAKPAATQRDRNRRRVRQSKQALPQYARGTYINTISSPRRIQVTPAASRKAAAVLRQMPVAVEDGGEGCGVTAVPLRTLSHGSAYLNTRAKTVEDGVLISQTRCGIRCPVWRPENPASMMAALCGDPHVVLAGTTATGEVFAVVRVANGTSDQQQEAVSRWSEDMGRRFPHSSGCPSWLTQSIERDAKTEVSSIDHRNWRAESLETGCFERYQTEGDYQTPLKLKRGSPASASERAKAYASTVRGLDDAGQRNTRLAAALMNVRDKFGPQGLYAAMPDLLARSTLGDREKQKIVNRVIREMAKQKG